MKIQAHTKKYRKKTSKKMHKFIFNPCMHQWYIENATKMLWKCYTIICENATQILCTILHDAKDGLYLVNLVVYNGC